jgi:menaquinol-cytochrome c reductase iron-sulfur subunit
VDPHSGDETGHTPAPTLWPVGFAVGIACILVGLIVGPIIVGVGAVLTALFGFLWIRDVSSGYRAEQAATVSRSEPLDEAPAQLGGAAIPEPGEGELIRYPRAKFLEFTTLGLGGVIGGIVTLPVLGFTILPPFVKQGHPEIDVGTLDEYPQGKYVITTFLLNPKEGEVSRRTAYIRNNGLLNGVPSFTTLSNRCAHLGCPVQVNGLPLDNKKKTVNGVDLIPTAAAAGFGCPCHGGQYDTEGNRVAGPPVRALDRYAFRIKNGHLLLGKTYSVSHVDGKGADAKIHAYPLAGPGQHVDGIEALLYPLQPPR